MSERTGPLAEDSPVLQAARGVRVIAIYLVLAGAVGLFVLEWSGLLAILAGLAVLGGALLIERLQSRTAALALLVAAAGYLAAGLLRWRELPVTALVLMATWVVIAALALRATVRYHKIHHGQEAS
jgi:hypothetical protein